MSPIENQASAPAASHGAAPGDATALTASPRLFENVVLDKLSRVHWSAPLFMYVPFVVLLGWLSLNAMPAWVVLAATVLGYAIWTLSEYLAHRYLFHMEFPGAWGARLHFLIHGVHHVHPSDPLRLVMPPLLSLPIMLTAMLVARLLFGLPLGYPTLMGFVIGYMAYDMVHYYVHHGDPKTRLGLTLRRLHMLHHFRDPERGYGVSAPYWDYVFGTQHIVPEKNDRRAS
jgi:dihydroceramide fatty acyl 2-hydroxylase